jgi:hypothetical protein
LVKFHPLRKFIFLLLSAQCSLPDAFSQYWQQQVNYSIDVTLNDKDHTLNGFAKIEYINHSPDTLTFIWFHLWPNAYKNDKTAFSDQLLENGSTRFYFSDKEERGYIHRLDFKVNNSTATTEDHPQHIDIVKLILPSPLPPGEKCIITTPFVIKLPYNFSRGGHDGQSYQATQWYPKPAVYDSKGWHAIPYLDQGEFYSEFGNFDVRITVPANYVVAATGELQNEKEREWLKTRKDFSWQPQQQSLKSADGSVKKVMQQFPESSAETKTLQFLQNNVHDFAWFADKRFIVDHDTCVIAGGKIIDVYAYYTPQQKTFWAHSLSYAKDALRTRSEWIGPYPYNTCSVVQGPESFGGGMEYPSISVISPMANPVLLDFTIAHEIGHNWFYGALASNERKHPWMDEGMNTFYDNRYVNWKYKTGEIKIGNENISIKNISRLLFETLAVTKNDQPIETEADVFTKENYQLIAYYKTGAWMEYLETTLGTETFDRAIQEYYRQWQHKHPYPEDFKIVMEKISGRNLDSVFSWLEKKGTLPGTAKGGWKHTYFPSLKGIAEYINKPSKNLLVYGPAFGFNSYDKFMLGSFFTNYKLPPTAFRFFLAPLYATGSKQFAGLGTLHFNIYPAKHIQKIDFFLNGSTFSANRFTDTSGNKFFMRFHKTVPGVRLVWREKNPRSPLYRFVQWKTYFIGEESLRFFRDTIISGTDTTIVGRYGKIKNNSTLNQLRMVVENHRALYPFSAELKIEQNPDFIRTAFTGNYFFNYARGGGLKLRLFAGKFFYLGSQTLAKEFRTQRYHLNMTGANGYEDYTYSDYFIGRNKFEGAASQQIMLRDGGFKTRTDLLASKVGKTDNWLLAANFSSDIPEAINFLKLLPVNIPVKLFADVGTYAEAWERNSDLDRFIFDAGIYFSLFNESLNIYLPLLYSSVFKDYIKSTLPEKNRWLKKISFIIDLENRIPAKNNKLFAL